MGFIDNLRQWTSEQFDKVTDQQNTYHRSSGKTQKEFENDLKTYKALEAGVIADSILAAAGLGVAGGQAANAAIAAKGLPAAASFVTDAAGNTVASNMLAPVLYQGTGLSQLGAGVLGGLGGAGLGGILAAGEKIADTEKNGIVDDRDIQNASNDSDSDVKPVESGEREEEKKEETKEEEKKSPDYDIDEMAGEFILGAWGNGQDRIDNMINAGYTIDDYNAIQQRVNDAYASGRDLHEWTNKANAKLHYW